MDEGRSARKRGCERFYTGFAARQAYLHGNDMRRGGTDGVPPVALLKVVGEGQSTTAAWRGCSGAGVGGQPMVFRAQVLNVAAKCIGYYG